MSRFETVLNAFFTDPYARKAMRDVILGYMLPDYRPQYNEVLEELSKFHYDTDEWFNRVYDNEYIFNYFRCLHRDEYDSGGLYSLRRRLGFSSIEELVNMMDPESESETDEDIEYNYNYNNDYCC